MLPNEQQQEQARQLFLQSNFTQQQIGDQLNLSRKTIGQWIQKGRWRQIKKTAAQAPGIVLQDFYDQLTSLNDAICTRVDAPYPTDEESVVQRRLMMSIKNFGQQPASNYIQIFTELLDDIVTQDLELAQKMAPYTDSIVQRMVERRKTRTDQQMFLTDEDPEEEVKTDDNSPSAAGAYDNSERLPQSFREGMSDSESPAPITTPSPLMERVGVRCSPCNPNVTSCNLTENHINQQQQPLEPFHVENSHQNKNENNTPQYTGAEQQEELFRLPCGVIWKGKEKVYDPEIGRVRDVKFWERTEFRKLFAKAREMEAKNKEKDK